MGMIPRPQRDIVRSGRSAPPPAPALG